MKTENKIAKLAYKFYLKRRCKEGQALADWLKAERIILRRNKVKNRFFAFIRHSLFLLLFSGIAIWSLQQSYLKREKIIEKKYEISKSISSICASYYQEIWNHWFAFRDKTPSEEYRRNIQRIVAEAKAIETQIPIVFKDKIIYEDWQNILHIFGEANHPISREGISEQQLNKILNSANPLIDDMLNRMYKELK